MNADLELRVAQAVQAVTILERALHDPGQWYARWGDQVVTVDRSTWSAGVKLTAVFGAADDQPHPLVEVLVPHPDGDLEVIYCFPIDHIGAGGFTFNVTLRAEFARVG